MKNQSNVPRVIEMLSATPGNEAAISLLLENLALCRASSEIILEIIHDIKHNRKADEVIKIIIIIIIITIFFNT